MSATLRVLPGGRSSSGPVSGRVLHPRSALAVRAGITPTVVPDDMHISPSLLIRRVTAPAASRRLRLVA